jgi:hypothetical protein
MSLRLLAASLVGSSLVRAVRGALLRPPAGRPARRGRPCARYRTTAMHREAARGTSMLLCCCYPTIKLCYAWLPAPATYPFSQPRQTESSTRKTRRTKRIARDDVPETTAPFRCFPLHSTFRQS